MGFDEYYPLPTVVTLASFTGFSVGMSPWAIAAVAGLLAVASGGLGLRYRRGKREARLL